MSTDTQLETPKAQKTKTPKDRSEKKSSKKRRHEETDPTSSAPLTIPSQSTTDGASPSKKQRTGASSATSATPSKKAAVPSATTARHSPAQSDLEAHSPFVSQTTSFYLPLSPVSHLLPIRGLCAEHLSPLLLTYHPPLHGIVLSYSNPRLSESPHHDPGAAPDDEEEAGPVVLARCVDEYVTPYVWLTADFVVLRPQRGCVVEGHVRVLNESYLGLVCWNYFQASIERRRLPAAWRWVEGVVANKGGGGEDVAAEDDPMGDADTVDGAGVHADEAEGYFVDESGKKVEGMVKFRVRDFESAPSTERERGFVSIEGTLLSEEEDKKLDDEDRANSKDKTKGRRPGRIMGSSSAIASSSRD